MFYLGKDRCAYCCPGSRPSIVFICLCPQLCTAGKGREFGVIQCVANLSAIRRRFRAGVPHDGGGANFAGLLPQGHAGDEQQHSQTSTVSRSYSSGILQGLALLACTCMCGHAALRVSCRVTSAANACIHAGMTHRTHTHLHTLNFPCLALTPLKPLSPKFAIFRGRRAMRLATNRGRVRTCSRTRDRVRTCSRTRDRVRTCSRTCDAASD